MKRIARYILNGLTVVSLLIFLATLVLWIRSYQHEDTFGWITVHWEGKQCDTWAIGLNSDSGGVYFYRIYRVAVVGHDESEPYGREFRDVNPEASQPYHIAGKPLGYPYRREYRGFALLGFGLSYGAPKEPLPTIGLGRESSFTQNDVFILFPIPFLAALFAVPPTLWVRRMWRKRRARRLGLCACGYDLRATTQGGRCPECGTVTPKQDQPQINADERR